MAAAAAAYEAAAAAATAAYEAAEERQRERHRYQQAVCALSYGSYVHGSCNELAVQAAHEAQLSSHVLLCLGSCVGSEGHGLRTSMPPPAPLPVRQ